MFDRLKKRARTRRSAEALLGSARDAARAPALFGDGRVPDTIDGRFESLVLHVVLVIDRLHGEAAPAPALSQAVFDALFRELDGAIREIGAGDLSVGKKVRRMGEAFYGRLKAYRAGLAEGDDALAAALERNLFATRTPEPAFLSAMARYVRACAQRLAAHPTAALLEGDAPTWAELRA